MACGSYQLFSLRPFTDVNELGRHLNLKCYYYLNPIVCYIGWNVSDPNESNGRKASGYHVVSSAISHYIADPHCTAQRGEISRGGLQISKGDDDDGDACMHACVRVAYIFLTFPVDWIDDADTYRNVLFWLVFFRLLTTWWRHNQRVMMVGAYFILHPRITQAWADLLWRYSRQQKYVVLALYVPFPIRDLSHG